MKIKARVFPVLRVTVLALLFLVTAAVQNTLPGSLKYAVLPLVPLTVSVCAFEGEMGGLFFGLLGGALYDLASPAADGVYALLFAALGCAVGLTMRWVFRNTLMSVLLLTAAFSLLTAAAGLVFTVFAKDHAGVFAVLRGRFLPGAALTALLVPLFYYPVRAIESGLRGNRL
jgi:cell shape-determining protein MreD